MELPPLTHIEVNKIATAVKEKIYMYFNYGSKPGTREKKKVFGRVGIN